MRSRKEAAALARKQLDGPARISAFKMLDHYATEASGRAKGSQVSYGKQEIRELLDFIYGGPPADESEEIP